MHLFQIWILEASMQSCRWWTKEPNVLPRGIAWTKKDPFVACELFGELFPEVISITNYFASLHLIIRNTRKEEAKRKKNKKISFCKKLGRT